MEVRRREAWEAGVSHLCDGRRLEHGEGDWRNLSPLIANGDARDGLSTGSIIHGQPVRELHAIPKPPRLL